MKMPMPGDRACLQEFLEGNFPNENSHPNAPVPALRSSVGADAAGDPQLPKVQVGLLGHEAENATGTQEGNAPMNFTITVTLTTHAQTDEHLRDEQSIKDEVLSWLEDLGAEVRAIAVHQIDEGKRP